MGQQQILLIVLSVILVGIAIAVGITMFQAQARQGNIDAMISDLNNLGSVAYQYKIRPVTMGGGSGSYDGFDGYWDGLPVTMLDNSNAIYTIHSIDLTDPDDEIVFIQSASKTQKAADNNTVALMIWIEVGPDGITQIHREEPGGGGGGE